MWALIYLTYQLVHHVRASRSLRDTCPIDRTAVESDLHIWTSPRPDIPGEIEIVTRRKIWKDDPERRDNLMTRMLRAPRTFIPSRITKLSLANAVDSSGPGDMLGTIASISGLSAFKGNCQFGDGDSLPNLDPRWPPASRSGYILKDFVKYALGS